MLATRVLLTAGLRWGLLASWLLAPGLLATLSTVLLRIPRLRTRSLPSLRWRSPLLVAELRVLTARLALLARLVSPTRCLVPGWLLVPRRWRSALCPPWLAARLPTTLLLDVSLPISLALAIARRILLWGLPPATRLGGSGGGTLLSTVPTSSPPLLVRRLSVVVPVPSSTLLFALALAAAVPVVHVITRAKVRGRANKRRPPFTWSVSESRC